jgi:hypothetical protein
MCVWYVRDRTSSAKLLALTRHLATKTDVADLRADVAALETAIIKWIIATVLASAALAFTIAKFVH